MERALKQSGGGLVNWIRIIWVAVVILIFVLLVAWAILDSENIAHDQTGKRTPAAAYRPTGWDWELCMLTAPVGGNCGDMPPEQLVQETVRSDI